MPDIFVSGNLKAQQKEQKEEELVEEKVIPIEQGTVKPLAAFVARPANLRFETQDHQEEIILFLRRHIITNVGWVLVTLAMAGAPLVIAGFLPAGFLPPGYRLIIIIGWYLLTFAFAFERFLSWFFNVNIITDERIVDINFPSILYKDISETKIDRIQDVSTKIGGYIRSLFDYGDVLIQTAGTIPEICFEAVPHPAKVTQILNELVYEEEKEKLEGRVR